MGVIRGLGFAPARSRFIRQSQARQYYCNASGDMYADWTADFAVKVNDATSGDVVPRPEAMYDEIYVDEVQDLVGYDLDVLDALPGSETHIVMVGDPRQHTYATNPEHPEPEVPQCRIVGLVRRAKELLQLADKYRELPL